VKAPPRENLIYDPIRCEWVVDQPEERVRQALLLEMIGPLGFPRELIAVERGLHQMPHLALTSHKIPKRRADIVAFFKQGDQLLPLLLIECKAVPLTRRAMLQVAGYNHFLNAPFICLANKKEVQVGWFDKEWNFISQLPHFERLVEVLDRRFLSAFDLNSSSLLS
jgi:Type I restriction enzyme R protein N terminus (HSDR_N)